MKCPLCARRKGKRFCPAKGRNICALCCGEKRVVEIACPPDCSFLTSGQSFRWIKKYSLILDREEDPGLRRRFYQTTQKFGELLSHIETRIVQYSAGLTSLDDKMILKAVEAAKQTYQSQSAGLIYEHDAITPISQALSREIREALEEYRARAAEQGFSITLADVLDCLFVLETDLRFHGESEADSYLHFIIRNHPDEGAERGDPGIIITG